jgi:MFS family permease
MLGAILCAPLIALFANRQGLLPRVAGVAFAIDGLLLSAMAFAPNLGIMLGLRFFEGAAHVLGISSLMAIGAGYATEPRRGRVMGMIGAAMMFGTACGTRLGGVVWTHAADWLFHIAAVIAAAVGIYAILFAREHRRDEHRSRDREPWTRVLRQNPSLGIAYAYAFIDRFCVGVVISTFVLFLADAHGLAPEARAKLLVLFLLPFAALVYPAGWLVDRIGRVRLIALGSAGFGVVFAAYGILPLAWMPVAMVLSGVLSAAMFAPNLALCADLAPESGRGAAFAGFNVAGSFGFLLGPLAAGLVYQLMISMGFTTIGGFRMAFLLAGGGEVLCAMITLPMLRDLARRGATH